MEIKLESIGIVRAGKSFAVELESAYAEDGTPVIDLKPYHPSSDTVRLAKRPPWCAAWPSCYEDSADFAWDKEFLF
jgi:tRNA (Thr-GGU) A37 N-methylase